MPTPFWAALASLLGLVLWLITRRPPRALLRSTDTTAVAALNRAQIELVSRVEPVESPADPAVTAGPEQDGAAVALPPPPRTAFERRAFVRQLQHWGAGDPEQRLRAVRAARRWSNPALLPLLRRGLRDGDPRVMAEAAAAIAAYRGRPVPVQPGAGIPPLGTAPRRVSRTR
jgi:HEAT repeat protein